jgi:hypothetical protein
VFNAYDGFLRRSEAEKSGLPFDSSVGNLGFQYQSELNRLVTNAKDNGIRVFGLTSLETQLQALSEAVSDNEAGIKETLKKSKQQGKNAQIEALAEKLGKSFLTNYVRKANLSWQALIGQLERHYPELKTGKSLVITGAGHNSSMNNRAVPMDKDYPSVAFIPDASGKKHPKLEVLRVKGSDEPKDPLSGEWEQPQGSPFEVRYPYRAPEIPQKSS